MAATLVEHNGLHGKLDEEWGFWRGYVFVPHWSNLRLHPVEPTDVEHWEQEGCDGAVHGGITYTNGGCELGFDCAHTGDHTPDGIALRDHDFAREELIKLMTWVLSKGRHELPEDVTRARTHERLRFVHETSTCMWDRGPILLTAAEEAAIFDTYVARQ